MAFDENRDGSGNRLLTGWKQVAFYFGKDESTAKRWAAQRGLPIHRVPGQKRASVYAWSAELETWLRQQADMPLEPQLPPARPPDPQLPAALPPAAPIPPAMPEREPSSLRRIGLAVFAVLAIAAVAGIATLGWRAG